MLVEFLPRGCVPACSSTCALNCQGVIMPWLLHLCLSQVYYQTKYSGVHGDGHKFMLPTSSGHDGQPSIIISTPHTQHEKMLEVNESISFLSWKKTKWYQRKINDVHVTQSSALFTRNDSQRIICQIHYTRNTRMLHFAHRVFLCGYITLITNYLNDKINDNK